MGKDSKNVKENTDLSQAKMTGIDMSYSNKYLLKARLRQSMLIAWIVFFCSFILLVISIVIMSMSWYPHSVLQGWPAIISVLVGFCSLIVAINQSIKYSKFERAFVKISQEELSRSDNYLRNNPANSVISLICAFIPLIIYTVYLIIIFRQPVSNNDQSPWLIIIYYWTIGIPIALLWLVCGILGLKSNTRNLAIASLVIKPVGLIVFVLICLLK